MCLRPDVVLPTVRAFFELCPQARKEVLVTTRHILGTEFRRSFVNDIDLFLDERVLVGDGKGDHPHLHPHSASSDSLRPLAFSTLADLIHHVRQELTLAQLSKTVHIFSRNVHDSSLPIHVQVRRTAVPRLSGVTAHCMSAFVRGIVAGVVPFRSHCVSVVFALWVATDDLRAACAEPGEHHLPERCTRRQGPSPHAAVPHHVVPSAQVRHAAAPHPSHHHQRAGEEAAGTG